MLQRPDGEIILPQFDLNTSEAEGVVRTVGNRNCYPQGDEMDLIVVFVL